MNDLIRRETALRALEKIRFALWEIDIPHPSCQEYIEYHKQVQRVMAIVENWAKELRDVPDAQPTLYGYRIEHLAYIARVMEKEGITAEDAARTFSDLGRAVSWTIDEVRQVMEEAVMK